MPPSLKQFALSVSNIERWQSANWPTEEGDRDCPFYGQLVEIAKLLGISDKEIRELRYFCGHEIVHEDSIDSGGGLSGRRGDSYIPRTFCVQLLNTIRLAIIFAEQSIAEDDEKIALDKKLWQEIAEATVGSDVSFDIPIIEEWISSGSGCPQRPKGDFIGAKS